MKLTVTCVSSGCVATVDMDELFSRYKYTISYSDHKGRHCDYRSFYYARGIIDKVRINVNPYNLVDVEVEKAFLNCTNLPPREIKYYDETYIVEIDGATEDYINNKINQINKHITRAEVCMREEIEYSIKQFEDKKFHGEKRIAKLQKRINKSM